MRQAKDVAKVTAQVVAGAAVSTVNAASSLATVTAHAATYLATGTAYAATNLAAGLWQTTIGTGTRPAITDSSAHFHSEAVHPLSAHLNPHMGMGHPEIDQIDPDPARARAQAHHFYIPATCQAGPHDPRTRDLEDYILKHFLVQDHLKVLLLLGDSGSGKTFFAQHLEQCLLETAHATHQTWRPLMVHLGDIKRPMTHLLSETLKLKILKEDPLINSRNSKNSDNIINHIKSDTHQESVTNVTNFEWDSLAAVDPPISGAISAIETSHTIDGAIIGIKADSSEEGGAASSIETDSLEKSATASSGTSNDEDNIETNGIEADLDKIVDTDIDTDFDTDVAFGDQPLLLILDGYEQLSVLKNIYASNGFHKFKNLKVLITCDSNLISEYSDKRCEELFKPEDAIGLVIQHLAPFTQSQRDAYFEKHKQFCLDFHHTKALNRISHASPQKLDHNTETLSNASTSNLTEESHNASSDADDLSLPTLRWHQELLTELPFLEPFTQSPLLLHMIARVLPQIHKQYRHQEELPQKDPQDTGPYHRRPNSEKPTFTRSALYQLYIAHIMNSSDVLIPNKIPSVGLTKAQMMPIPEVLRRMHASFDDYALASACAHDPQILRKTLGEKSLRAQPELIRFMADQVRLSSTFKKQLLDLVKATKEDPDAALLVATTTPATIKKLEESINAFKLFPLLEAANPYVIKDLEKAIKALKVGVSIVRDTESTMKTARIVAANAITILNADGTSFAGMNLAGVQIPGADLRGGIFHGTHFRGATLSGVRLAGAWLHEADLTGADLTGADFGGYFEKKHSAAITSCAYSKDGQWLAIGLENGQIIIYDAQTLAKRRKHLGHKGAVYSIDYNVDNQTFCSGSADKTIRIWDATGLILDPLRTHLGHRAAVRAVTYHPNGSKIASGSDDRIIRFWDSTGQKMEPLQNYEGHTAAVHTIAYSPSGNQLASGSADGVIRLWDTSHSNNPLHQESLICLGHTEGISSIAFHPDGRKFCSASHDDTLRIWDLSNPAQSIYTYRNCTEYALIYTADGTIYSGSADGKVRVWDADKNGREYALTQSQNDRSAFESNASAYPPGPLKIYSTDNTSPIFSLGLHPQSLDICFGSTNGQLYVLDTQAQATPPISLQRFHEGHKTAIRALAYHPRLLKVCSGAKDDPRLIIWDPYHNTAPTTCLGHSGGVSALEYSLDGSKIYSGSSDQTIKIWDIHTLSILRTYQGHTGTINVIRAHPDPDALEFYSGSNDNTVMVWDEHGGSLTPKYIFEGHQNPVISLSHNNHSSYPKICSGSTDGTLKVWNLWFSQLQDNLKAKKTTRINELDNVYDACAVMFQGKAPSSPTDVHYGSAGYKPHTRAEMTELIRKLRIHSPICSFASHPLAPYWVTGLEDGSILQWQILYDKNHAPILSLDWRSKVNTLPGGQDLQLKRAMLSPRHLNLLLNQGAIGETKVSSEECLLASGSFDGVQLMNDCLEENYQTLQKSNNLEPESPPAPFESQQHASVPEQQQAISCGPTHHHVSMQNPVPLLFNANNPHIPLSAPLQPEYSHTTSQMPQINVLTFAQSATNNGDSDAANTYESPRSPNRAFNS